ncbi:MAG: response regulator [Desulfobacterales bacterium]|nr:response regulator [Desulfobacterales bacterium]
MKTNILLIEDNMADVQFFKTILFDGENACDISFEYVESVHDALKRLEANDIDLIFLDINLPDSNGFETFQTIYNKACEIPIIILTGTDDKELALKALKKGAEDYFIKDHFVYTSKFILSIIRHSIERRHVYNLLKKSEKKLRSVIEKIADAIVIINSDGKILFVNPAAISLLGFDSEDLVSKQFGYPFADYENTIEIKIVKKDNSERFAEIHTVEICWEEKKAYLLSIRDITKRKELEERVIEEEQLRVLIETTGAICHELHQPMQAILGYCDLLMLKMKDEQNFTTIQKISNQIQRMSNITKKLSQITRYKTKNYLGDKKIIDIENSIISK